MALPQSCSGGLKAFPRPLFDPALIDQVSLSARDDTTTPLVTRPLQDDDFDKGYLELLSQLSTVGDGISKDDFRRRFDEMVAARDVYYPVVIEDTLKGKIVASATLIVEKKILHGLGLAGHIEDVVVDQTYRGYRLGLRVIEQLQHIAKVLGCYKVILDCGEHNVPFYERCGFTRKEVQMVVYTPAKL